VWRKDGETIDVAIALREELLRQLAYDRAMAANRVALQTERSLSA
jgi:hypothetical protein